MKKGISHAGQRKEPRSSTVIQVDYHTAESFFRDFVDNISAGGMFIATPKPLEPGAQLRLEFLLPGCDYPIRVNGKVAWSRSVSSEGQRRGMGVTLDSLSPNAKDKINTIIKHLRSIP